MNTTLMARVRCSLSYSKQPEPFRGKALLIVVYVLNCSPCVPLDYEDPEKVRLGNSISYGYLLVLCWKAFVHVPKDKRSKLDVKTR